MLPQWCHRWAIANMVGASMGHSVVTWCLELEMESMVPYGDSPTHHQDRNRLWKNQSFLFDVTLLWNLVPGRLLSSLLCAFFAHWMRELGTFLGGSDRMPNWFSSTECEIWGLAVVGPGSNLMISAALYIFLFFPEPCWPFISRPFACKMAVTALGITTTAEDRSSCLGRFGLYS